MKSSQKYSPHPRGCFLASLVLCRIVCIFPASAGVFLKNTIGLVLDLDIPRIRGGVSKDVEVLAARSSYSPHPRGCFWLESEVEVFCVIFPASAGVFLKRRLSRMRKRNIPRIRGGVSGPPWVYWFMCSYSPHPRGCFSRIPRYEKSSSIFPASAGVFPRYDCKYRECDYIPRIRGGVSSPISQSNFFS